MQPRERVLRLLLLLLARPNQYTIKNLSDKFERSTDTIREDIEYLKNVGLQVSFDKKHYRYTIIPDNQFKELKYLQPLTEKDKAQIGQLLDKSISNREATYLKNKLNSLYDFQKLGLQALRRPAIERIERLELSRKNKTQATLKNYRSNSNNIKDRHIEVFDINPEFDTIQAFDITHKATRHFRLSRVERVEVTDIPWQYEGHHRQKSTDVFRIANNDQLDVQLSLNVYAYNALIEKFPRAKAPIEPGANKNTYDFQAKVNAQFLGLTNFIMGNARHIIIHSPESLKVKIREEAEEILKKNQET